MNINNSRLSRNIWEEVLSLTLRNSENRKILVFVCANHDEMIHVAEDVKQKLSYIDASIEDNRCMTYSISKCNTTIIITSDGLLLRDFSPTDVLVINNKYIPTMIEDLEKESTENES